MAQYRANCKIANSCVGCKWNKGACLVPKNRIRLLKAIGITLLIFVGLFLYFFLVYKYPITLVISFAICLFVYIVSVVYNNL